MQTVPLVTVITPTFNHAKYIADCIESVIAQTFQDWEMIIVNGGSTDNTGEVIEKYLVKDIRIKLINQENVGVFKLEKRYNEALRNSNGKYIAIIEGDDLWENTKIEKQVLEMEKNDEVIMCWSNAFVFNSDTNEIISMSTHNIDGRFKEYNNNPVGSFLNLLFFENPVAAVTTIIRKDALIKTGGFIQNFNLPLVDITTLFELAKIGVFAYIDEPLAKWRTYANQTTKTFTVEILKGRTDLALYHFHNLPDEVKKNVFVREKELRKYFENLLQIAYARSGRYKLIRREFANARKDYLKAIFYKGFRNPVWRLRAIIGYVYSLFKMDVEGLSKSLGKNSYKKA
jgi:glycosyltransferase involved in cell wall biosynthesis